MHEHMKNSTKNITTKIQLLIKSNIIWICNVKLSSCSLKLLFYFSSFNIFPIFHINVIKKLFFKKMFLNISKKRVWRRCLL